jgi:hypothetical protein
MTTSSAQPVPSGCIAASWRSQWSAPRVWRFVDRPGWPNDNGRAETVQMCAKVSCVARGAGFVPEATPTVRPLLITFSASRHRNKRKHQLM